MGICAFLANQEAGCLSGIGFDLIRKHCEGLQFNHACTHLVKTGMERSMIPIPWGQDILELLLPAARDAQREDCAP
jgi:hypothetical protein